MRTSPPVDLTVRRFGAWHAAVWLLTGLVLAAQSAWWLSLGVAGRPLLLGAVALTGCATLSLGAMLARTIATRLRWDGHAWFVGTDGASDTELVTGRIEAMLDLGTWILLRFTPAGDLAPRRALPRATWIPTQRHGLEREWHGLRCALHSPAEAVASRTDTGP